MIYQLDGIKQCSEDHTLVPVGVTTSDCKKDKIARGREQEEFIARTNCSIVSISFAIDSLYPLQGLAPSVFTISVDRSTETRHDRTPGNGR